MRAKQSPERTKLNGNYWIDREGGEIYRGYGFDATLVGRLYHDQEAFAAAMATQDVAVNAVAPSRSAEVNQALIRLHQGKAEVRDSNLVIHYVTNLEAYSKHERDLGYEAGYAAGLEASQPVVAQKRGELTIADYEECFADHRRLVRQLDVALNGEEGAAKQASLCDIVGQVLDQRWKLVCATPAPSDARESVKVVESYLTTYRAKLRDENPSPWWADNLKFAIEVLELVQGELKKLTLAPSDDARECARLREAMNLIDAERERQKSVEGWTVEHDDQHENGELLRAGISYYLNAMGGLLDMDGVTRIPLGSPPSSWPWDSSWWKPKTPLRDLERAGALFKAEQERCERAGSPRNLEPRIKKVAVAITEILSPSPTGNAEGVK